MRVVGVDVGTSSLKSLKLDDDGKIVAQCSRSYPISQPRPGWSEQNPSHWWSACQECLAELGTEDVGAIGLTGQMHGSVFLDRNKHVIRPALLWNDSRTEAQCRIIERKVGRSTYEEKVCNRIVPGLQLPKVLWLRDEEPDSFHSVDRVLLPKDYVAYRLTGSIATDPHDGAGTGCMDQKSGNWSDSILDALDLPRSFFPDVIPFGEPIGDLHGKIPVFLAGGDQAANGIGSGCLSPETACLALGSSGVVFRPTYAPSFHPSGTLNCFGYVEGLYHLMAVIQNCGTAIESACTQLFGGCTAGELSARAELGSEDSGLLVAPLFGGERCPVLAPRARYAMLQQGKNPSKNDLARAVLEGIVFLLRAGFDFASEGQAALSRITISGGGSASRFLLQSIADLFGIEAVCLANLQGPAFGAALMAGYGAGQWSSLSEAAKCVELSTCYAPKENANLHMRYWNWRKWMDSAPYLPSNSS